MCRAQQAYRQIMNYLNIISNYLQFTEHESKRKPTGKRPVGRPKQRWMDNIEKNLKRASLSLYGITTGRNQVRLEELVGDRERWKDITAASMAGRAFRMTT